jgi:hypothetical protein
MTHRHPYLGKDGVTVRGRVTTERQESTAAGSAELHDWNVLTRFKYRVPTSYGVPALTGRLGDAGIHKGYISIITRRRAKAVRNSRRIPEATCDGEAQ